MIQQTEMNAHDLLSMASIMFFPSRDLGPPLIQVIWPDGPLTWREKNKLNYLNHAAKRNYLNARIAG